MMTQGSTSIIYYTFTINSPSANYVFYGNFSQLPQSYTLSLNLKAGSGTVKINSGAQGSTASASIQYNTSTTIYATANTGYYFEGWYEGSTKKSSSQTYTFNMPQGNTTYSANFLKQSYTLSLNLKAGSGTVKINSGAQGSTASASIQYNTSTTIYATANTGYYFEGWYEGSTKKSSSQTYTFNMPQGNTTYSANFLVLPSYTLSLNISYGNGTVKINSGTQGSTASASIQSGTSTTIYAVSSTYYQFSGWYNGANLVSNNQTYTFNMPQGNTTYSAKFTFTEQIYENIIYAIHHSKTQNSNINQTDFSPQRTQGNKINSTDWE